MFFLIFIYKYKSDMKIIINENQFKNIIKENYDQEIMDKILDKYNNTGESGLSNDELNYLKSGGQTEIPNDYKEINNNEPNIDFNNNSDFNNKLEQFGEIMDSQTYKYKDMGQRFAILIPYSDEIYDMIVDLFEGNDVMDSNNNFIKIRVNSERTLVGVSFDKSNYEGLFSAGL